MGVLLLFSSFVFLSAWFLFGLSGFPLLAILVRILILILVLVRFTALHSNFIHNLAYDSCFTLTGTLIYLSVRLESVNLS